jgi:hypothetical protein
MDKDIILRCWNLIKDAMNPNNSFIVKMATDDLFFRIETDRMKDTEDFISFKQEWYSQMKNR